MNEKTRRIGKEHASIEFEEKGAVWRNAPQCRNGTIIDERHLSDPAPVLLRQGSLIRPADVLAILCTLCYDDPLDNDPNYGRFADDLGAGPASEPTGTARAVRLRRLDDLAELEQYLIFQRGASIGSGATCPIHVPDNSVGPIHAHVVHIGGSFWLEAAQKVQPTLVDGTRIEPGRLVPLRPNLLFQLGQVVVTVTAFQQYYVDVMPPDA